MGTTEEQPRRVRSAGPPPRQWLTAEEADDYLGLTERHLRDLRHRGAGPAFSRPGKSTVSYSVRDLDEYMRAMMVRPAGRERKQ